MVFLMLGWIMMVGLVVISASMAIEIASVIKYSGGEFGLRLILFVLSGGAIFLGYMCATNAPFNLYDLGFG